MGSKLGLDTGSKLALDNKMIFLDPSILFLVYYTSFSMSGPGNLIYAEKNMLVLKLNFSEKKLKTPY